MDALFVQAIVACAGACVRVEDVLADSATLTHDDAIVSGPLSD
jgi:hypothetical protein